jgi:formylglycine-generating enzyme required for sulfatase activity
MPEPVKPPPICKPQEKVYPPTPAPELQPPTEEKESLPLGSSLLLYLLAGTAALLLLVGSFGATSYILKRRDNISHDTGSPESRASAEIEDPPQEHPNRSLADPPEPETIEETEPESSLEESPSIDEETDEQGDVTPVPDERAPIPNAPSEEIPPLIPSIHYNWPFDEIKAQSLREETARKLDIPLEYENSVGMTMRLIPVGFCSNGTADYPHRVTWPIYASAYETTQSQWIALMGRHRNEYMLSLDMGIGADHPMYAVTYFDAVACCISLSENEGREPYYQLSNIELDPKTQLHILKAQVRVLGGNGYRLPAWKEWEFTSRAGEARRETTYRYSDYAWEKSNSDGKLQPVGGKLPNAFQIYDTHGNACDMTHAWSGPFGGPASPEEEAALPYTIGRSVDDNASSFYFLMQNRLNASVKPDIGFRVVCSALSEEGERVDLSEFQPVYPPTASAEETPESDRGLPEPE